MIREVVTTPTDAPRRIYIF